VSARAHISFSELKDWKFCPFYHNLVWVQKLKSFEGNEYTAFGTAIHDTCEKKLLGETFDEGKHFLASFKKGLNVLEEKSIDLDMSLVEKMIGQGVSLLPDIAPAVDEYFKEYEVVSTEEQLYEPIEGVEDLRFKGFIDATIKTPDGKYHIIDWKTCSWGWDARRRQDPMVTYQLTLYKKYFCAKHNIDPKNVETYFALLKRTAKNDKVEIFRVTSGARKTENAFKLLMKAVYNIKNKKTIKNRLSCTKCTFRKTEHCP
tara:strand:- start:64073 stop:64849 length:777 start_codon:yes stop_codon:yes gene_type:complete